MKKHALWTLVISVVPLSFLFLLQAFHFQEIINDVILLVVLLIILVVMPKDFEDVEEERKPAEPRARQKQQFLVSPKNLGLSIGVTFVLLHLGCIFIMYFLGHDGTVSFFNNMFHGMDFSTVVRMDVSFTEMLAGSVELFIVGAFIGFCIAGFYNIFLRAR